MTVYADSLFLVNFIAIYFMLTLTENISLTKISIQKKIISSILGALISVLIFCIDFSPLCSMFLKIGGILIILIISYLKNISSLKRITPIFIAILFVYTGIISILCTGNAIVKNGITYISINEIPFMLVFAVAYCVILVSAYFITARQRIYHITIFYNLNEIKAKALFDSGNLLSEHNKSVIIVEWNIIKKLFDLEFCDDLYAMADELNLRLLPFKGIGSQAKTVMVFNAENVFIQENGKNFKNVPIGIISSSISDDYHVLIGKEYI